MTFEGKHNDITGKIIGAFFKVYNQLGYGFSEKVYENALVLELKKLGLEIQQQMPIQVFYEGQEIGEYAEFMIMRKREHYLGFPKCGNCNIFYRN